MPLESLLLYLLTATLPFPLLGIPVKEGYLLSASSVVGLLFAVLRMLRHGVTGTHVLALLMLFAFAATAAPRYPISSYVLSLGALSLAIAPVTSPAASSRDVAVLVRGLLVGLRITLALVGISIAVQLAGLEGRLGVLGGLIVRPEAGAFFGYVRPAAGFGEPSHLAIYLVTVLVALDLLHQSGHRRQKLQLLIAAAVVFTGSLSGLLLLVLYFIAKTFLNLRKSLSTLFSVAGVAKAMLVCAVVISLVYAFSSAEWGFLADYLARLDWTLEAVASLNLVGSEGSRANAFLALPDYWASTGLPGFVFGTGYANYEAWLFSAYGDLPWGATFARGEIDNVLVAVFLSTGLFGLVFYLAFLGKVFGVKAIRTHVPMVVLVLGLHFVYGNLIASLYWSLLFVLASIGRYTVNGSRRVGVGATSDALPRSRADRLRYAAG